MPDHNLPHKPRRRGLFAPFILVGLLAIGWSGWWFYLRGQVEQRMDAAVADLRKDGYTVKWASRSIGGYPFRVMITLTGAEIAEPSGYGLSAPVLEAESAAYSPNPIVLAAPQGAIIRRPGGRAFAVKGKTLLASISQTDHTPPRISVSGTDLQFAPLKGATPLSFSAMERLEFRITPTDGDRAKLFLRLQNATPANNALLERVAAGTPVTLGLEGEINGASFLKGSSWTEVLQGWSRAKGSLAVAQGGIQAGEAVLSLRPSTLAVDADGRLAGELALSLTRASQGVMALGAVGVLPQETASVAAGLTGVQLPGGRPFEATLNFRDGQTWLGPLPLGPAPKVY